MMLFKVTLLLQIVSIGIFGFESESLENEMQPYWYNVYGTPNRWIRENHVTVADHARLATDSTQKMLASDEYPTTVNLEASGTPDTTFSYAPTTQLPYLRTAIPPHRKLTFLVTRAPKNDENAYPRPSLSSKTDELDETQSSKQPAANHSEKAFSKRRGNPSEVKNEVQFSESLAEASGETSSYKAFPHRNLIKRVMDSALQMFDEIVKNASEPAESNASYPLHNSTFQPDLELPSLKTSNLSKEIPSPVQMSYLLNKSESIPSPSSLKGFPANDNGTSYSGAPYSLSTFNSESDPEIPPRKAPAESGDDTSYSGLPHSINTSASDLKLESSKASCSSHIKILHTGPPQSVSTIQPNADFVLPEKTSTSSGDVPHLEPYYPSATFKPDSKQEVFEKLALDFFEHFHSRFPYHVKTSGPNSKQPAPKKPATNVFGKPDSEPVPKLYRSGSDQPALSQQIQINQLIQIDQIQINPHAARSPFVIKKSSN